MARDRFEDLSVKDIMDRWPRTVPLFIRHGLKCVGCPIGPFHTLDDAAREHGQDRAALLLDLTAMMDSQ